MEKVDLSEAAILRQKGEELLNASTSLSYSSSHQPINPSTHQLSQADTLKLIHELQVRQIELEMQNDELTISKDALRKSEETFRSYVENSFDIIFTLMANGDFLSVSDAWARHFGFPVSGVIGKPFSLFVHPDDVAPCFEYLTQILTTGKSATSPAYRVRHADGTWPWFIANGCTYINAKGEHLYLGVGHDITERRQAEAEIKLKNEELIKINAEKNKFISIIAHELHNPFNSLLGLTRLMDEELPTLTMEEIQKIAVTIRNSANKHFKLLENLLEWSMMQRGILTFKPGSFILLNGIVPILDLLRGAADKKMIRFSYDLPEDLRVMADRKMFESLIRNLVFNAIKFTPTGGKIIIVAKQKPDNSVEISINDTGIGMNKDLLDSLFTLGEDTSRQGTGGESGSGLGLNICKDFVEKHGGKIWAESEVGKGSTFYFTLANN